MKLILLFSDRLSQLQPTLTAVNERLPDIAFDVCSDIEHAFRSLTSTDFSSIIVYLDAIEPGYISFLTRLRKEPEYRNLPVMIYKELPAIDGLVSFLESL